MSRYEYTVQCRGYDIFQGVGDWYSVDGVKVFTSYELAQKELENVKARYVAETAKRFEERPCYDFRIARRYIGDWHNALAPSNPIGFEDVVVKRLAEIIAHAVVEARKAVEDIDNG